MDAVDPIEACTESMAALAIVNFLTCLFISFALFLQIIIVMSNLFLFQAGPWVATVSARVKNLQCEAKSQETRVVKAKEELRSAKDLVQVMSD